jgi:hypothetical protein
MVVVVGKVVGDATVTACGVEVLVPYVIVPAKTAM